MLSLVGLRIVNGFPVTGSYLYLMRSRPYELNRNPELHYRRRDFKVLAYRIRSWTGNAISQSMVALTVSGSPEHTSEIAKHVVGAVGMRDVSPIPPVGSENGSLIQTDCALRRQCVDSVGRARKLRQARSQALKSGRKGAELGHLSLRPRRLQVQLNSLFLNTYRYSPYPPP